MAQTTATLPKGIKHFSWNASTQEHLLVVLDKPEIEITALLAVLKYLENNNGKDVEFYDPEQSRKIFKIKKDY